MIESPIAERRNPLKLISLISAILVCGTVLLASHWITEGRRYDVVLLGAGAGGSQDAAGSTDFQAMLVDHKTGNVWTLNSDVTSLIEVPNLRVSCKQTYTNSAESETGCIK